MRVLVTGATGYVGGRLVPKLLDAGAEVRCFVRTPGKLDPVSWRDDVEVVRGDLGSASDVRAALAGVDVAYYLVHSISARADFAVRDRELAHTFAKAARDAGIARIVYLGGLGESGARTSPHLASRTEVGEILLRSGVPTAVLRAAIVLGAGSVSFEMLRYLTERLPVMVTPMWIETRVQPIAIADALHYLVKAGTLPAEHSRRFDIGGPEVMSYNDLMDRYAAVAGLQPRRVVRVPVLTPNLSSLWVGLVTPVPNAIARPLVESLRSEVVCQEQDLAALVGTPEGGPTGTDAALRAALTGGAGDPAAEVLPTDPDWAGGPRHTTVRRVPLRATADRVWRTIAALGGPEGYRWPAAWQARGVVDRLFGGPGFWHGRENPATLRPGDVVDFWRVDAVEAPRLLRLRSRMVMPGEASLEFRIEDGDRPTLLQRLAFRPRGLAGELYWRTVSLVDASLLDDLGAYLASAGATGGERR